MDVPVQFGLLGRTIKVKRDDRYLEAAESEGEWHIEKGEILLRKVSKDKPADWVGHTFCHELVHALLEASGRDDLSKDETLVDVLGGLLHQVLSTAEYEE